MTNHEEIRWQQRFGELKKAYRQLNQALAIDSPDEIYRAGIIQFFEMTLELAWKTMKDYLEFQEIPVNTPRETIQKAFQIELIRDGHTWIDALQKRNLMAHTYDEERALEAELLIRNIYVGHIGELINHLASKENETYSGL